MRKEVLRNNAHLLWIILPENPANRANLNVDRHGNLYVISKCNLIGRLIKWIQNRKGSVTLKIQQVATETLDFIKKYNLANPKDLFYVFDSTGWDGGLYATKYSADQLAQKMQQAPRFNQCRELNEMAQEVIHQRALYETKGYVLDFFREDS